MAYLLEKSLLLTNNHYHRWQQSLPKLQMLGRALLRHISDMIRFIRKLGRNLYNQSRRSRQTLYEEDILDEILSNHDWQIKDDSIEGYELLVGGLKRCADVASVVQFRTADRIPSTTKELLK
ncbi:hypothetical protein KIN20_022770 [Parelaphostrongylus tenuis]|uniref:Uncharacterized protein n=1 Tax=Parelaphostrongylus tenuis TaxID=148309 RepID=A0AAD5N5W5_PARTN|nr:hypothetical protein KIN20_022770 [Parelaphostrongylus tenuis]